ncbi:hypothetical protein [Actinoplanes aureus]|uniref:Lipoprotein n=1 Tax=Actinoplanes aureus TaxID=2792083 RepID=A0A931CGF9_9ACTN|nr:hypothetical protein [Actinoplanes aureus]MBG0567527.1 hypothetical protein [Actinoplanes aureus]
MRACRLLPAALAIALALAGCGSTRSREAPRAATSASLAKTLDDEHEHDHDDGRAAAPSAPAAAAALDAARSYVTAWARPDLDQATWYTQLRPLVIAEYARLLADTDPANVAATAVTGAPTVVSSTTAVVVADVPTDAGAVRVTVVRHDTRWLVATAEPVPEPS